MFTTEDIVKLRKRTNAGMMDCKNALTETNGDLDKATIGKVGIETPHWKVYEGTAHLLRCDGGTNGEFWVATQQEGVKYPYSFGGKEAELTVYANNATEELVAPLL